MQLLYYYECIDNNTKSVSFLRLLFLFFLSEGVISNLCRQEKKNNYLPYKKDL